MNRDAPARVRLRPVSVPTSSIVVATILVATCLVPMTAGTAAADRRAADTIGVQSTPIRPFLTGALPHGWRVVSRSLEQTHGATAKQSLFLPPTSTAAAGPAILAGYIGDDEGVPFCPAVQVDPVPDGAVPARPEPEILRSGRRWSAIEIDGPTFYTSNDAYVVGRDVSAAALRTAARTLRWTSDAEPPEVATPPRFRLRATSGLAFGSVPFGAAIAMDGPGHRYLQLGQQRSNRAALRVATFWRSAERTIPRCAGFESIRQRTFVRGHTVYRLLGRDTPVIRRVMDAVQSTLQRGTHAQFCRIATSGEAAVDTDPRNLCRRT